MVSALHHSASHRRVPRARLHVASLAPAAVILMATLPNSAHLFLIAGPTLGLCWLTVKCAASDAGIGSIRFSSTGIVLCAIVGAIVTLKLVTSLLYGATGATGLITGETFVNRWGGDMLWLCLLLVMILLFTNTSRHRLQHAIRIVFAVHAAAFLLQLLVFHVGGYVLDFSGWLGADTARTGYLTFFRPTGLRVEPSTFAGVMVLLLACDSLLARRVSTRMLLVTAGLSVLSFSTAAWAFAGLLVFIVLPLASKRQSSRLLLVLGCIVGAAILSASQYGQIQAKKLNHTSGPRTGIIPYVIHGRPAWENVFGPVVNGMPSEYYSTHRSAHAGTNYLGAPSTAGTGIYLLLRYGFVGFCAYLLFLLYTYRRLTLPIFLVLFVATLTKLTPNFAPFTVLAGAAYAELLWARGVDRRGRKRYRLLNKPSLERQTLTVR